MPKEIKSCLYCGAPNVKPLLYTGISVNSKTHIKCKIKKKNQRKTLTWETFTGILVSISITRAWKGGIIASFSVCGGIMFLLQNLFHFFTFTLTVSSCSHPLFLSMQNYILQNLFGIWTREGIWKTKGQKTLSPFASIWLIPLLSLVAVRLAVIACPWDHASLSGKKIKTLITWSIYFKGTWKFSVKYGEI